VREAAKAAFDPMRSALRRSPRKRRPPLVIPAKAGIQHLGAFHAQIKWVPAFAGTTLEGGSVQHAGRFGARRNAIEKHVIGAGPGTGGGGCAERTVLIAR
jgi:hypothetical protein